MTKPRIVAVGEGMVELSGEADRARIGYGGDTLNTAIHLARFRLPTAFFTALGRDHVSDKLRSGWTAEGLDTSLILTDPERQPGLYAISTDDHGERSFTYWRSQSAAGRMFELEGAERAIETAQEATLLYFSLISLAIVPTRGREKLLELADRVRASGGKIAFDGNYRPRLWQNSEEATAVRDAAVARCDIGLPTLDDEQSLSGLTSPASVAEHWRSLGAGEVVVKMGSEGAFVEGSIVPPPAALEPVDTTGAGDAFNAAYLAARLKGKAPPDAALFGHSLGAWVIMRPGAIPPVDDSAPYSLATA